MNPLVSGLLTGIIFGFLLQRGGVLRYEKQLGALRLIDMTIFKFMFSAIVVGAIGLHLLLDLGVLESLSVRPAALGSQLLGGVLFGIGWALFGLCPGTAVGALGEGRWHVLPGIAGMLVGAALFAEVYPALKDGAMKWGQIAARTLPDALGVSPWFVLATLLLGALALFRWFEKNDL
jgi:uncharacterized membrane protein YedE/YeeE